MGKSIQKRVRILNEFGLHIRPVTLIVKLLQEYKSEVTFTYEQETINARSILNILMLAVPRGAFITIYVQGFDAKETMQRLIEGFESRFGEDPTHV